MPSSPQARRKALKQVAQNVRFERTALRGLRRKLPAFRRTLLGAVKEADMSPISRVANAFEPFVVILRAMSAKAFAAGHRDTVKNATEWAKANKQTLGFSMDFAVTKADITFFNNLAGQIFAGTQATVSATIASAVEAAWSSGVSIKLAQESILNKLTAIGLGSVKPHVLETWAVTFAQASYSAGKFAAGQSPAIQNILWGYEYVTVGDDRVRPEHEGFDGTVLPKGDSFWQTNTPPNGWRCRCSIIDVFQKETAVAPHAVDGVIPVTAPGFTFNPADLLAI